MTVSYLKENMKDNDQTKDEKGYNTPRIIVGEKRNTNARYKVNRFFDSFINVFI